MQFLYFVVIRKQDQAAFRDLHGNARADLKSRFSQPFGADFDHRRVAAAGQMLRWQHDGQSRMTEAQGDIQRDARGGAGDVHGPAVQLQRSG